VSGILFRVVTGSYHTHNFRMESRFKLAPTPPSATRRSRHFI
jgi:hypothetical protein